MKVKDGIIFLVLCMLYSFSCQPSSSGKATEGATLFKKYCVNCHGIDGSLKTNGAVDLRYSLLNKDERELVIREGRNTMTAFGSTLNAQQIQAVATYTLILSDTKHNDQ
jgi:mono/diheme cytochrome c family protein